MSSFVSRSLSLSPWLICAAACAAPAQPAPIVPCPAPAPTPVAAAPAAAAPAPAPSTPQPVLMATPLPVCAQGLKPAAEGLVDDFEDGNNQVALVDGRNGYWWVAKAEHASIDVPGSEFRVSDGGAPGSKKAAHFTGKTDTADVWGASLGGNLLGGGFYDATKYAGVGFKLKGTAKSFVRFKIHDVNTHPDGGICTKECWNAFGKTIELTGDWQNVELAFSELHQLDGWGSPRPPSINASKLKHLEWSVDQGEKFDFWVDDVKLLACK